MPENYLFTLFELRQAKGYSQRDIAGKLQITQGYYNEIEKGKKTPNIDILHGLAMLYDTSMDFIYHCFYRQKVTFYMPDKFLAYGLRKCREKDTAYIGKCIAPTDQAP